MMQLYAGAVPLQWSATSYNKVIENWIWSAGSSVLALSALQGGRTTVSDLSRDTMWRNMAVSSLDISCRAVQNALQTARSVRHFDSAKLTLIYDQFRSEMQGLSSAIGAADMSGAVELTITLSHSSQALIQAIQTEVTVQSESECRLLYHVVNELPNSHEASISRFIEITELAGDTEQLQQQSVWRTYKVYGLVVLIGCAAIVVSSMLNKKKNKIKVN